MKKILMSGLLVSVCAIVGCEKKAGVVQTKPPGAKRYYCTQIVEEGDFFILKTAGGESHQIPKSRVNHIKLMPRSKVEERYKAIEAL